MMNKAQKNLSAVASWESTKKVAIEAKLKKLEVANTNYDYTYIFRKSFTTIVNFL